MVEEALAPVQSTPDGFSRHVAQRTVVLPELRVLFLPVPKAGCTSVLWLLAELAELPLEKFSRSAQLEPSAVMTIHDMGVWGAGHRLSDYEGDERERILTEDGWFRFSLVRDPGPRLWSGWQSKLLLREPRFVETFGDRPWFPRLPERPSDLVDDFRRFVAALTDGDAEDVHWAVQHDLVGQLPLTHVGHVERLDDTLELLRAHLDGVAWPARAPRENRSPLSMPPHAFDDAATEVLRERYRDDYERYGYDPPHSAGDAAAWEDRAAPLLPLLRVTIDQHTRVGQLHRLAQQRGRRAQTAEEKLETAATRATGGTRSPVLTNLEGHAEFNVRWSWADGPLDPGLTAVVRAKNEANSLPWVLAPLLRAVERVVLIDNGSTDGTAAVARRAAEETGAADRLEIHDYPFAVARCGPEHLGTPVDSVHSLAYFYNWSFSHVRTSYVLKWDGDMVLTDAAVAALRDLAWQLEAAEAIIKVPRNPLYVAGDRQAYLDAELRNCEAWGWPNRPGYSFVKAIEWELPLFPPAARSVALPDWSCVELKHLDADEFAHWSSTDFAASARTQRKRREWQVFGALTAGREPPEGVVRVEAPPGRHVIEHVRSAWLPGRAGEPPRPTFTLAA
jgi:Sulfotransferase family